MAILNYQAIPDASLAEAMENGGGGIGLRDEEMMASLSTSAKTRNYMSSSSLPSINTALLSKIGYITLGLMIGLCSTSESGVRRALWNPTVKINITDPEKDTPSFITQHNQHHDNNNDDENSDDSSSGVMTHSFSHALPFEEVFPGMKAWADTLPSFLTEESKVLSTSSSSSPFSSFLLGATSSGGGSSPSATTPHLLYLVHPTAVTLLYDTSKSSNYFVSEYSLDYFLMNSGGFDAQINQAYCAVASVGAVLNSLKYMKRFRDVDDMKELTFDLPIDQRYAPYPYATQKDILLGDCVKNNVIQHGDGGDEASDNHLDGIFKPPYGLNMAQAADLLRCHTSDEWEVTVQEVDPSRITLSKMRFDLKAALIDPDARVLINYHRQGLGQVGGGHFSPLGSYHPLTDSFLIMDVAKYKYPPVWVGATTLFAALSGLDTCAHYDYPKAQERLVDNTSDGSTNHLFNPLTPDEYTQALNVLGCKPGYRGYVILKKK